MGPRPAVRPAALAAALLAAAACAARQPAKQAWPAAPARPEPRAFLWEITRPGGGAPLYLTGSLHVARRGQLVFPPALDRAVGRADALVLEVDPRAAASQEVQGLMFGLGTYSPPDGLDAHLDPRTRALLPDALRRTGLAPRVAEHLKPWMLAVTIALLDLERLGYRGKAGLEELLLERLAGREVLELETAAGQLRVLAGMPEAAQVAMLRDAIEGGADAGRTLEALAAAWLRGDAAALEAVVFERAGDPELAPYHEAFFFARNRAMADRLAPLVGGEKVHLAAVGAGHVVGPRGVLALLEARGFAVRQLEQE